MYQANSHMLCYNQPILVFMFTKYFFWFSTVQSKHDQSVMVTTQNISFLTFSCFINIDHPTTYRACFYDSTQATTNIQGINNLEIKNANHDYTTVGTIDIHIVRINATLPDYILQSLVHVRHFV